MLKKENATKKVDAKNDDKKDKRYKDKLVMQKGDELLKWRVKNAAQKWFFSLEDNEQKLLEKAYLIFVQQCPELIWEDYLDRLRKSDQYSNATKAIIKKVV